MKLADLIPAALLNDENDAIGMLEADHDKVLELFERFDKVKDGRATKSKEAIVVEACNELTVHTRLEEEVFYPAIREALDDDDLLNEALVEHESCKALIADLEGMDAGDDMFDAKFTVLAEFIRHHVEEEREEMFPKVRSTDIDLKALGQKMAARKQQILSGKGGTANEKRIPAIRQRLPRSDRQRPFPIG